MGLKVEGRDGTPLEVNRHGQAAVAGPVHDAIVAAGLRGDAYTFSTVAADIDVGDTMLFVKNLDPRPFILVGLTIEPTNVDATYNWGVGNATTTPAGTAVAGVNMNPGFSNAPSTMLLGLADETAVADATISGVTVISISTDASLMPSPEIDLRGHVLPTGCYFQLNQETESTGGRAQLRGYYA